MNTTSTQLHPAFLDQQRRKLTALRNEILSASRSLEKERTGINAEASGRAREYEEEGQRLASLELEEELTQADRERLTDINRALQKIDEGTYGVSDGNHAPIPRERLEATPEALYTIEEQRTRDGAQ